MTEARLLGARRLRELCERHGIRPRRSLGQNFVIDPNTIRKVVDQADIQASDVVLEIGAGAGSLTLALAATARKVIAVEIDRRLVPLLKELLAGVDNVEVRNEDASDVVTTDTGANKLVANLPYNVAVTLVLAVLESAPRITSLTVMTQREAGERLAAMPGSKVYGGSSVLAQFFADVAVTGPVSRKAFWPIPNVDSVTVSCRRREELPDVDVNTFFGVVNAAFGQRRKMLRNSMAAKTGDARAATELLERAGIDPAARAEEVGVEGYVALARLL
jgi:16S rRNA (adenine1518-N6/adenine1519-N6)-dimethyltransferase